MAQPSFLFRMAFVIVFIWVITFMLAQSFPVVRRVITVVMPTKPGSQYVAAVLDRNIVPHKTSESSSIPEVEPSRSAENLRYSSIQSSASTPAPSIVETRSSITSSCSTEESKKAPSILVTAFSQNHFREATLFIHQAQANLPPNWEIWVFNLGDWTNETIAALDSYCRVRHFKFQWSWLGFDEEKQSFSDILTAMKDLTNSLWKPVAINKAAQHVLALENSCGYVIWGDASVRMKKNFFNGKDGEYVPSRSHSLGFYGRGTTSPLSNFTHPRSFELLSAITADTTKTSSKITDYTTTRVVCGCFSMWHPSHPLVVKHVLKPWVKCAQNITCMVPDGSEGFQTRNINLGISHSCRPGFKGKCHRGDQSILSTLVKHHALHLGVDSDAPGEEEGSTAIYPAHYTRLGMVLSRGAKRSANPRICTTSGVDR